MEERPFSVVLVAGWFALGGALLGLMAMNLAKAIAVVTGNFGERLLIIFAIVFGMLAALVLLIAIGLWRGDRQAPAVARVILALTFIATVPTINETAAWPWAIAAGNAVAFWLLMRAESKRFYRARSM